MSTGVLYRGEGGIMFNPKIDGPLPPSLTSPAIGAHLPTKET